MISLLQMLLRTRVCLLIPLIKYPLIVVKTGECAASQSLSGSENAHSRSSSLSSTRSNTTDSSGRTPLSEKSITCSDKEPLEDDDDAHERGSASGETVPDSDSEESGVGEDEEDESEEYDEEWESENDDHEPPAPDPRYDESTLLAAERLLSRTLAVANADPDMGMAAEIRKSFTFMFSMFFLLTSTSPDTYTRPYPSTASIFPSDMGA